MKKRKSLRQGGRRPRLLGSMDDLLVGLDGRCLSWTRLFDYLHESPDATPPGRHLIHWGDLSDDLQDAITGVVRAAEHLRRVVAAHLGPSKPSHRSARP